MLSPLLVALLCAASDSAPQAPFPAQESSVPAPLVSTPPSQDSAVGPLVPGSWGLGFRVLGNGQNLVLRRALSDRMSVGMKLGWGAGISESFSESGSKSFYSGETSNKRESWNLRDEDNLSLNLGIPVEWLQRSHRPLRFAASAGPIFEYSQWTAKYMDQDRSMGIYANSPSLREINSHTFGLGATGAVGMRWYFLPDLALAADFGASALWTHTTSEDESQSESWRLTDGSWASQESWNDDEIDRVTTNLSFLGIGLEAWF